MLPSHAESDRATKRKACALLCPRLVVAEELGAEARSIFVCGFECLVVLLPRAF
jgi:hypothetical protein